MNYQIYTYLDTSKKNKMDEHCVYLRFFRKGSYITVFTGLRCRIDEFDNSTCQFVGKNAMLNEMSLGQIMYKLREYMVFTPEDPKKNNDRLKAAIEKHVFGKRDKYEEKTLIELIREYTESKPLKATTVECFNVTIRKIEEFGDVCINDIDVAWLNRFDQYMATHVFDKALKSGSKARKGLKVNSRSKELRNVRSALNFAIDAGYTTNYPFRKFKIKQEDTMHRCLTADELVRLKDAEGLEEWQEEARDLFMLEFYLIGINNMDLLEMKDLTKGRCVYRRNKTGKLIDIAVLPEAKALIEKYRGKKQLLNPMDRYGNHKDYIRRMNKNLSTIGKTFMLKGYAKGKSRYKGDAWFPGLTMYWARHTWATIACDLDIPMETISQALSHSTGEKVTQIYVKFDKRKIDEANRKVADYINELSKKSKNLAHSHACARTS